MYTSQFHKLILYLAFFGETLNYDGDIINDKNHLIDSNFAKIYILQEIRWILNDHIYF